MAIKKILIVGPTGQLAFDLIRVLRSDYQIIEANRGNFDICDFEAADKFIKNSMVDIVINTAAYHKTEECELNPEKSFNVNAPGAFNIANSGFCPFYEWAKKIFELYGIKANLIAISSSERPSNLKRPKYSPLVSENFSKIGIKPLRPWQEALGDFMLEYNKK